MTWHLDYHTPTRGLTFACDEVLYTETSNYQKIEIVQSQDFGKVMLLDGVLMVTEKDEFVYHEMLSLPSLNTHPNPRNVLIIGGGDCGTLSRVLSHPGVEHVIQVEIDEMVSRVARLHFPQLCMAADDPRAELIFGDGIAFVKDQVEAYDVILIDSTDPVGPAEGLFRKAFFGDCHRALKSDGILCLQSESPWIENLRDVIHIVNEDLKSLFEVVMPYTAAIQTYQAGLWMFQMASRKYHPLSYQALTRAQYCPVPCKYYNAELHMAAFRLPGFVFA